MTEGEKQSPLKWCNNLGDIFNIGLNFLLQTI